MAERFQRLFTLTPNMYADGCPIIIEAGALQKDTETGAVLAQIKMRNLGDKVISSCKVSVKAFENNGDEVEGVSLFSYLDLAADTGKEFGSKVPVILPDQTARSFTVDINEIVFADGTVKELTDNEWKLLPKQTFLEAVIKDPEHRKQYASEVGGDCSYYPEKKEGFYLCTCGAINLGEERTCYKCGRSYDALVRSLDTDTLTEHVEQRLSKEAEQKRRIRSIAIKAGIVAAIIIAVIVVFSVIKSMMSFPFEIGDRYDKAQKYMANHGTSFEIDEEPSFTQTTCYMDYFRLGKSQFVYIENYPSITDVTAIEVSFTDDNLFDKAINKLEKKYGFDTMVSSDHLVDYQSIELDGIEIIFQEKTILMVEP